MKKLYQQLGALCLTSAALFSVNANASGVNTYSVTITNATHGQVMTPALVIAHDSDFSLFSVGAAASAELAALAEDGNTQPLSDALAANPMVYAQAQGGLLLPGQSTTVMIQARKRDQISLAGMLASTNDAFYSVHNVSPKDRMMMRHALAYDAGSEANSESCAHIPGPPCGNPHMRNTDGAEGFVSIHAGIHNQGMEGYLDAASHDWRGPVAIVKIMKMD